MKFEIYHCKEETVTLKLFKNEDDEIEVMAIDKNDQVVGSLLKFGNNGRIQLFGEVDPVLGFDLDKDGMIKIHR